MENVRACESGKILEVGNVLSHYFDLDHTVVDKFEKGVFRPVIMQDILEYSTNRRFDLIVSVSTVEHVGLDDGTGDTARVLHVFPKLCSMLTPNGLGIVALPVGYNLFLDQHLAEVRIRAVATFCLKRVSEANEWVETGLAEALGCAYGRPFPAANAVVFLLLRRQAFEYPGSEDRLQVKSDAL